MPAHDPTLHRKTVLTLVAGLLLLVLAPSVLWGAPLAVTRNRDLTFGRFVGGGGRSGTVRVDVSGARSATSSVILLTGDSYAPAQFTITANSGTRYTIVLPASLSVTSGASQMTLSQLTASIATSGVVPASGSVTFLVGGTLTVGSTQGAGSYSGTFDVTVLRN
ncbi:DUF4402 domain-containing protein [Geomonas sp. RF6]|uniref:DUF4402 domain-containing protein n=1 Tax=Geomonas sp. RF6 TaxID=2897342 RepID=UPI001E3BBE75|nr:DUF4402 domain-containing protein [Geomonas sp. RF6]UFS71140.1 DUF4402 domain-containing protein [Geomonas sp. RF6]